MKQAGIKMWRQQPRRYWRRKPSITKTPRTREIRAHNDLRKTVCMLLNAQGSREARQRFEQLGGRNPSSMESHQQ